MADLHQQLGSIPLERIRFNPPPGTATRDDVIDVHNREGRLCELVKGVLVEKPMGLKESLLAIALAGMLRDFVIPRNLGIVAGSDGPMELFPDLVRLPDVAYVSWEKIPGGRVPQEPIPQLAPSLAVEVLSRSNTPQEMPRKREEYFQAGVIQVWMVDPDSRTIEIFTEPENSTVLSENDTLDGGPLLPGFELALAKLFAELDRSAQP